jgi:hypothetical protein
MDYNDSRRAQFADAATREDDAIASAQAAFDPTEARRFLRMLETLAGISGERIHDAVRAQKIADDDYRGSTANATRIRSPFDREGPALAKPTTPLDVIDMRIFQVAQRMEETAFSLNLHADRVYGPTPSDGPAAANQLRDEPSAAIDRIFVALDVLDRAYTMINDAASRNTTLA